METILIKPFKQQFSGSFLKCEDLLFYIEYFFILGHFVQAITSTNPTVNFPLEITLNGEIKIDR